MDVLLDIIRLHLFLSLPQGFFTWLLAFSFLRPQPPKLLARLLVLVVIHSILTDTFVLIIPVYLTPVNSLGVLLILIMLVFKDLELRKKIFVYIASVILAVTSETVSISIAMSMGVPEIEAIRTDYLPEYLSIVYPQLLLFAIAGWLIRRRQSANSVNRILANLNERKPLIRLFALFFFQFVLISLIIGVHYSVNYDNRIVTAILIYLAIAISLCAIVFMIRMLGMERTEAIRATQALYVEDINNMFTSVRGQRHDFLNHVQVIHTMAQMGKYEQLRAYTSNLVQETREINDIMNHSAPALAAFAQAKTTVALGYDIAFTCDLPQRWSISDSAINMLDIIKILGNLVDNAFDEANQIPASERIVHARIQIENEKVILSVANRGRPIDNATLERMLQPGYTTKGEDHSGLGLAIIKERVQHYGGTLQVDCDIASRMTNFTVCLPYESNIATRLAP